MSERFNDPIKEFTLIERAARVGIWVVETAALPVLSPPQHLQISPNSARISAERFAKNDRS